MIKILLLFIFTLFASAGNIEKNCKDQWKNDYRMIKYCIDKQSKARSVLASYEDNEIMAMCKKQWKDDYRMVKYCYDKQSEAKRSLGL